MWILKEKKGEYSCCIWYVSLICDAVYDSELSITILEQKDETWWSSKPFRSCYSVFLRLIDEVPVGYQ